MISSDSCEADTEEKHDESGRYLCEEEQDNAERLQHQKKKKKKEEVE